MEIVDRYLKFFNEFIDREDQRVYVKAITRMISEGKRSLYINFVHLLHSDPSLANDLLDSPEKHLEDATRALKDFIDTKDPEFLIKLEERVYCRYKNTHEHTKVSLRDVRSEHIKSLISVEGIVTRVTEIRPLLVRAQFRCLACGMRISRDQREGRYNPPVQCENPECTRKAGPFSLIQEESDFIDWQKITMQEKPEELPPGQMPQTLSAILLDDLTASARPGDRVRITGILRTFPDRVLKRGVAATFAKNLGGLTVEKETEEYENLEISDEDIEKIKELAKNPFVHEKIRNSIVPSIYGYELIKEGISLLLFGGTLKETPDGVKIRGESNILLIGDPGVGKSQILKFIADLGPRALYTSGKGSSAAGLCVSADSYLFLSDGKKLISQIVEKEFDKGGIIEFTKDIGYKENNGGDIQTLISQDLKITPRIIEKLWRIKSPGKLVKITSRTGRELKVTPQTSIFSIEPNLGLVWKPAKFLKPKDRIAEIRNLPLPTKYVPSVYELIKDFSGTITLLDAKDKVGKLIESIQSIKNVTLRKLALELGVSEATIYTSWRNKNHRGNISLAQFKALCKLIADDIEKHLPDPLAIQIKKGQTLTLPKQLDETWFYVMGLIVGDGRISIDKRGTGYGGITIGFSNRNKTLLRHFRHFFESLGFSPNISEGSELRSTEIRVCSKLIYHILAKFGITASPKSKDINPNPDILYYHNNYLGAFLRGLFDSDGWISLRKEGSGSSHIGIASTSKNLIQFIQNGLLKFGILSYIREKEPKTAVFSSGKVIKGKNAIYELSFRSYADMVSFKEKIGFAHPTKKQLLLEYCESSKKPHRNVDTVPGVHRIVREIMDFYGYHSKQIFGRKGAFAPSSLGKSLSRERLSWILDNIDLDWKKHRVKIPFNIRNRLYKELRRGLSVESIVSISGLTKNQVYDYFTRKKANPAILTGVFALLRNSDPSLLSKSTREYFSILIDDIRRQHEYYTQKFELLDILGSSDIFWDEIKSIEEIDADNLHVYDLTIPGTHNFIVNGFVVHNTAAVMRDPETGEMTLEAGALVLADQGIAAIDEFDKMRTEDRSAIHEAMEQHTISIAKAGIVATLNARTSILAAANPKFGRWNPYKEPGQNINLPPTLISRFDLVFVMQDKPDPEEDREKAFFILSTHKDVTEAKQPAIPLDLLTKYIAYSRQNCYPKLTDEAIEIIMSYYLKLREESGKRNDGVPSAIAITPRQLESLIRMAESRARMSLNDFVTEDDAAAAVRLMDATMREIARDLETGEIDADLLTLGTSRRTRGKYEKIMDIIDQQIKLKGEDQISVDVVVTEAIKGKLEEQEVFEFIEQLKRDGVLYEPLPGFLRKI